MPTEVDTGTGCQPSNSNVQNYIIQDNNVICNIFHYDIHIVFILVTIFIVLVWYFATWMFI